MKTRKHLGTVLILLMGFFVNAQTLFWKGTVDSDFFNEANWQNSSTLLAPSSGAIDSGVAITLPLSISNATNKVVANGTINLGTTSLTIGTAWLSATALTNGTLVTINASGYIDLSSVTPITGVTKINFTSGLGWLRTTNFNTNSANSAISQFKISGATAVYKTNLRLDNYYLNGCVIRANLPTTTTPLTVYDSTGLTGSSGLIPVNTIYSGTAIAGSMNNKIESFILKKGYMVTFANETDGTGKSKNYIASEEDLVINTLPLALQNAISFIRVMPWNWVTKKGRTDIETDLNSTWVYKWNSTLNTTLDWEYAPMAWGWSSAEVADIPTYTGKYNSTHVMAFNEPDNCSGQSGQYVTGYNSLKLCDTDAAVYYYKNLMKTGMRLVSPGCTEDASRTTGWLKKFYDKAIIQDIRIDVIAVHWYDWGNNPTVNNNPSGLQVFNRFKAYLTTIHDLYGLPIWITEFNANPARSQTINSDFMALALPYLESLDYIERYNWFPYNTGTDFYTDVNNTMISLVGTTYRNQISTPSISEANVVLYNNLQNVALNKTATASSTYSTFAATNVVDGDTTTSTSRWLVEFATKPLPASLEVDLQGSFTINSFRIIEDIKASKDFSFEVWDATLNAGAGGWSSVLSVTNNPATPLTTYKTFTPVTTTKVRLNITGDNGTGYIRMFELEVYGEPNNPTWTGATSTAWTTATNWSTGIVPDKYSNVTIAGAMPNQPTISTILTINSLNIATEATLTVTAANFTVTAAIASSGTMNLANNCNLIQGGSVNANTGNISVNRNSNALKRLDYSMWSSPITGAQTLSQFSPLTTQTPTSRFYTYDSTVNLYSSVSAPTTTTFAEGTGYLIRMPNTDPTVDYDAGAATLIYPGVFTGIPNNGTVKLSLLTADRFYFVGNPYPSIISANLFLSGNSTGGTLYFWRKTNGVVNSNSAYATWTTLGGTVAGTIAPNNIIPNGTIQVGQGFIVKTGLTATSLTFNNTMRASNTSTQFLKTKQAVEPDRIWLNLTNATGVFSQALMGYMDGFTQGVDNGIDGKYINDSPISLTSNINDEEYSIQGRPTFDASDSVCLNFKTDLDGEYTIAIDHFDGVFAKGQDIYLLDIKTGVETDLKSGSYTFSATSGIDNTRFSLKYQKTLKVDAQVFNENNVRVYKKNGTLYLNSGVVAMNNIKVYDLQGRLIAEQKNVKATTASIKDLKATHQVLIVKIASEDNSVVAKKVVY